MRFCIFFFLLVGLYSCKPSDRNAALEQLRLRKEHTDALMSSGSLQVLAKVAGSSKPVVVTGKKYPPNIELTYNVLKDNKGRIIYLAELPYSSDSDWFISYKSYFDTAGNLYAFQRINNFLHSKCTKGAAMEKLTRYYDAGFKVIDSAYTLTDSYNKPLDKSACSFPYNFAYQVIPRLEDYKIKKGIGAY